MITNHQLELYNKAAVDALDAAKRNNRSLVKRLAASRKAALETIDQSDDGLHIPEGARDIVSSFSRRKDVYLFLQTGKIEGEKNKSHNE